MNFPRKSSYSSFPASLYSQVLSSANVRRRQRIRSSVDSPTTPITRAKAAEKRAILREDKRQLRRTDWTLGVCAVLSVGLGLLDSDLYWVWGRKETGWLQWLRLMESCLTLWICNYNAGRCLYLRYRYLHTLSTKDPVHSKYESFFLSTPLQIPFHVSPLVWSLLLEVFLCSAHNPPFLNYSFSVESLGQPLTYSLNDVLTCLLCVRLYLLARLVAQSSPMLAERPGQWCYWFGVSQSPSFGLKWTLHFRPLCSRVLIVLSLTALFAVVIRIWERAQPGSSLENYSEDLWLVFVTSTSVGFGDLAPRTHLGRGSAVLACLGGSLYLGLLVQGIQQLISMTPSEEQAYSLICQRNLLQDAKLQAGKALRIAFRILYRRIKPAARADVAPAPLSKSFSFQFSPLYPRYHQAISRFRLLQAQARAWSSSSAPFTMQRLISEGNTDTSDIIAKCKSIAGESGELGILLSCVIEAQKSQLSC